MSLSKASSNLNTVLHDLKSEKVKERQQGLASLRTVFARNTVVLTLDESGKGQAWLSVFQALYTTVGIEKTACTKKGPSSKFASSGPGAAALRRLGDAAATVRWLTERSVQRMNKAVVKSLFTHLVQTMVYNGELLTPVALDYIKALRCLVSWTPHMDHLNEEMWIRMVEMAFNIILGDPIRRVLDEDPGEREGSTAPGTELDDSEFYLEYDLDEDIGENLPSTSTSTKAKKRRRVEINSTPRPSTPKLKSKPKTPRSVSLEQIEFTSLLAILLQSPSAPLISPNFPNLASAVLRRLHRFLELYPADTSLHHDYILSLSATLSHLALNRKSDVEIFARGAWDGLVGLWGTKNKAMKEGLVAILRLLFPYLTTGQEDSCDNFGWAEGIGKLWHLLDGEAESRWGVDGLSFESLRLEAASNADDDSDASEPAAFVARTFRAGWHFDAGQALAWAILELQADCAEKLFQLSESVHLSANKGDGKRTRLENPITSLLHSVQTHPLSTVRAYHLQILLFFIDRHWSVLHHSLQQDVIGTLLQFVSLDDAVIQSWTFLCFSAIAYADCSFRISSPLSEGLKPDRFRGAAVWDPIWTHAIRRANVPGVCRAACHAAYVLLFHSKQLLTSQRILFEIETLAKDLDVQGPAFPYDSICVFLAQCLRVASQDVRLYRMQLEEKVLSWLMDSWGIGDVQTIRGSSGGSGGRSSMPLYMIGDLLILLESVCGFSKQSNLISRVFLPDCPIVEMMVDQGKTKVIREFLLNGNLPPFGKPSEKGKAVMAPRIVPTLPTLSSSAGPMVIGDLAQPRGRERRISTYLLKSLETLASELESINETNGHPTAEKLRKTLDLAVVALSFESLLIINGTRSTRRVIQGACKLVVLVTALLTDPKWTLEEKALILLGLEPLISQENEERYEVTWEAILRPDSGAGIKTQTLRRLISNGRNHRMHLRAARRNFQRIMLQSADVQDTCTKVMATLRDVLRVIVGQRLDDSRAVQALIDVDDKDGFGPIRTTQQSPETRQQAEDCTAHRCIVEVCISFLAVVPILQSSSGEPTRDKELTELVLYSDNKFHLVASHFFDKVGQRVLNLSSNNLEQFLTKIGELLKQYNYSRSENLQMLVTHFLDTTLHLWLQESVTNSEIGDNIRALCHWLADILSQNKIRSWKLRDYVARFLDRYLANDPNQVVWIGGDNVATFPSALLPMLGADRDIRVRFRAAVLNARLFSIVRAIGQDCLVLYHDIKRWLTLDLNDYEHMLTRMLSLGNIMVASSAVRRGPYWHLLEICLHSSRYPCHIEAILMGVSERLGLTTFSMLFEAYASQIAYSIRQARLDFLRFPSHLLGYRDRKDCAEAAFRAFTPTNVLAGGSDPDAILHGQKIFVNHCRVIQKSPAEGIRDCFGEIVGFQIVSWIDEPTTNTSPPLEQIANLLKDKTITGDGSSDFDDLLQQNVDGIVIAILRTLSDQDFSSDGAISQALRAADDSGMSTQAFQGMTRYRRPDDFDTHSPNLPTFCTRTVLQALAWLSTKLPDTEKRATSYHVLHELFADVHRSPFVNEQIRLLNAITLWVAMHHGDFEEPTLLHTLIHGATSLLTQSDLARAAQSILEWAFSCYHKIGQKDACFPDILIRICCLAHDYALDTENVTVATIGNDLIRWIDCQALALCKNTSLRGQVVKALPAWPHQPSPELTQIYEDITSESLSAVLGDHRISSNKFRLVRRLRDLAVEKQYDEEQFAKTDFWRLKECIPPVDQLQDDDVNAFASLLVLNKGQIRSFWSEQSISQSVRVRHRRGFRRKGPSSAEDGSSPHHAIVLSLLAMLDGSAATHVHVAYRTLRFLMSVLVSDIPQGLTWPSEYRQALEYLQAYPRTPGTKQHRDITELSTSESFHDVSKCFPEWIAMVTTLLSDILGGTDTFYAQLTPILRSDVAFAEQMLPVLVHTALQAEITNDKTNNISYRRLLSNYFTSLLTSDTVSTSCLRSIVDIVLHLRHFRGPNNGDALSCDKWLDIDFTLLARNAITCGAYTTALLFLELAADYRGSSVTDDAAAEQILFDIYSHIDEPDGFYGIKTKDLSQFLIKRFHHEKQWEKAFRFHGAAFEAGNAKSTEAEGLVQSFHSFGFNHLAIDTLQSSSIETGPIFNLSGMSYRSGWRTETWDLPDQTEQHNPGADLYLALRAIHRERDPHAIDIVVRRALSEEMERLRALGTENLSEIREVTRNLMCISQVTQWRDVSIQTRLRSKQIDPKEWTDFIHIGPDFDFSDLENIMATRISLIRSVRQKEEREQMGTLLSPFVQALTDIEKKSLVRLSEAARAANQIQIALNSVVRSQKLEKFPSFDVSQEFASVLWLQKEQKLAVQYLKELVTHPDSHITSDDQISPTKKALLLARLGAWTSEACLEKPTDILINFFDPATTLVASLDTTQALDPACAAVYHQYAIFAQHQYHAILKSPDAVRWKVYVDRKVQEIKRRQDQILRTQSGSKEYKDLTQDQRKAQTLLQEDQELYQRHNGARDAFLEQAIDMYSRCLEISNDFDDDGAIRLCSLWFANFDDVALQDKVRVALDRVPSRKFVFLAHQLSARLSKSQTLHVKNQENLQSLMVRMCEEHPFHSLYQVYCLRPERSSSSSMTARRQSTRNDPSTSQSERGYAACDIFDRLRGDPSKGERVRDVERICDASLQWAQYPIKDDTRFKNKRQKGPYKVPEDLLIRKVQKVRVPVVTVHTPLDPTLRYDNCVWVERYEATFETAGGINLPKISVCYGSDGEQHKQLFKGEGGDDLRQDAVMEQVFDLVNIVLRRDRETRRRNLGVRDYKVIPLAAQAGVLEFVGNTSPLQGWLYHAHQKYRPNDLKPGDVHGQLEKRQKEFAPRSELLALFLDIRTKFKPVMRHYFTERHKNPISWFAMRLNYTRSVATTSIVGHILGLGDRHVSNILIDNITGQIVHIDLGIAFEQGKLLPIPERVPFRMTADMVDGMGMSGTQGVFQRCAEETLRVLREGSEVIMTVLEVFKHDPLHSWTASELKLKRVQGSPPESTVSDTARFGIGIDMTSGTADEAADRALTSVARKLDKALSVEYTINELIAEATDPVNLATIYAGWGPYY